MRRDKEPEDAGLILLRKEQNVNNTSSAVRPERSLSCGNASAVRVHWTRFDSGTKFTSCSRLNLESQLLSLLHT